MYKLNDIVKIRKEWQDDTSEEFDIYIITNVNESTERCYIQLINGNLNLPPTSLVSWDMIEKIETI